MRGSDSIDEMLSYLEEVIRPGMKVIFLVHLGLRGFQECMNTLLAIHLGMDPRLMPQARNEPSWQNRQDAMQMKIEAACQGSIGRNIEVSVKLYAGRSKYAIRDCLASGEVQWVLVSSRRVRLLRHLLNLLGPMARFLEPSLMTPIILLHPPLSPRAYR